ncbi:Biopolymer transport protein ExbD/TolR [Methylophaga frappieri]|uniref:Biopolymer transport protein ExbD/TolR n=1 Tax=Methylophaga frappieri (strain ATCC BAA-2434 / DSM 25690 / JAM7) TaxID=754477 RepID=I1YHP6_METFJ|nr:biopolymer transporter ExbD [Methylophaga frappieri]AFJ02439.1 Biopolymer transport protein ExbD/TolR [Methylophaga frappieri]
MKLLPRYSEEPDVNLTPMIDVVFLLLLFFMISTSFIRESSLKVDLPQATGETMQEQAEPIDIVINANGDISINDLVVASTTASDVRAALRSAAGNESDPHIIISADASAAYQLVVTAMDAASSLGFARLTLATRQTSTANP